MGYKISKRLIDLFGSIVGLIIFLPLIILIGILIKMDSPSGPVIYKGVRAAQFKGTFNLYKFRTMVPHAESLGGHSTALDDKRLTLLGKFIRGFKLDELPQFLNVFMGDMSLVGPRPQVTYYTNLYKGDLLDILSVKPGITDLASLSFINMDKTLGSKDVDSRYEKEIEPIKNQLRLKYVRKKSLGLDLTILFLTIMKLLRFIDEDKIKIFLNKI